MSYVTIVSEDIQDGYLLNGWSRDSSVNEIICPNPLGFWDASGPGPNLGGFVLFAWVDAGGLFNQCNINRDTWSQKLYTGLIPGTNYGLHMHTNWQLNTGTPRVYIEGQGATTVRAAIGSPLFNLWTIPPNLSNVREQLLEVQPNGAGEILVLFGIDSWIPSCNSVCLFNGIFAIERFTPSNTHGYIMKFHTV